MLATTQYVMTLLTAILLLFTLNKSMNMRLLVLVRFLDLGIVTI